MQTAAQSLLDNIAVYKAGYYEIDASANFVLVEEAMEEFRTKLISRYDATEICGDQIENILVSISDLFTTSKPNKNQVPETHEQMDCDIIQLKESITNHEDMMVQVVDNSTEPLINLLESSINKAGSNIADVGDYESGKFYANTDVDMLMKLSQYLNVQHENNKETYDEIWDAEKQIKAEEEEKDGIWETIAGVGLIIAGGICIVATAGAATPIVVAGGIAGGGTMLFGMSNTTEGIQHIYYGKTGDISSIAMNPLRDSVFNGNEKAYYITENVFEFSSSVLPIAGMASKAGKTAVDMGAKGAKSAEGKSISEIAKGGKSITKPNQVHHYATNKNKVYTPQFEEVAKKYGLNLDDTWNKDLLPHQGRHPNAYHNYVLDSMKQFDEVAQGNKEVFMKLYENMKKCIQSNPDMLYKNYWN